MATETEVKITPEVQALIDAGDSTALNAQFDPKQQPRDAAGKFVPKAAATEPAKEEPKVEQPKEELVYKMEVELYPGKSIFVTGASEAEVNAKAELVQTAAAAARSAVEPAKPAVVETPKPAITADELFKIGTDLQAGKVEAVETYLEKSNFMDRYFEKRGIKLDDVKTQLAEKQTTSEKAGWENATKEFNSEHPEYAALKLAKDDPRLVLFQHEVATAKLNNPAYSPKEAIEAAYVKMTQNGWIKTDEVEIANEGQPEVEQKTTTEPSTRAQVTTKEVVVPKKKATSSTMFGTDAGAKGSRPSTTVLTPKQIAEATKDMDGYQMAQWYNEKVRSGEIRPQ